MDIENPAEVDKAVLKERQRCAQWCETLAEMLINGAGQVDDWDRLLQARDGILSGEEPTDWFPGTLEAYEKKQEDQLMAYYQPILDRQQKTLQKIKEMEAWLKENEIK